MSEVVTIPVNTPSRSYDVVVGAGIIDDVGARTREVCGGDAACIISDSNVAPLYANAVAESLENAGYTCTLQVFPAGEASKNIDTLSDLLEGLAESGLTRTDVVVAVGGGVTGDMAGLAAALYLRGCQVVQVPTSLLAMVDSSVGGKTAIDLSAGKNLAGAFFQPSLVVADVDCLDTLTPSLFADSCGEVIKHGVIADAMLFESLAETPMTSAILSPNELVRIVSRNVEIKRDVVSEDEREHGLRQILNFGHTIGHAIEAASNFELGHGSGVAAGMCCIARAAAKKRWCDGSVPERIESVVRAHGLPTDTDLEPQSIVRLALRDKKRRGGSLGIVVPERIGHVALRQVSPAEFEELVGLGCGA